VRPLLCWSLIGCFELAVGFSEALPIIAFDASYAIVDRRPCAMAWALATTMAAFAVYLSHMAGVGILTPVTGFVVHIGSHLSVKI
jgi:hypothetical protein